MLCARFGLHPGAILGFCRGFVRFRVFLLFIRSERCPAVGVGGSGGSPTRKGEGMSVHAGGTSGDGGGGGGGGGRGGSDGSGGTGGNAGGGGGSRAR